MSTIIWPAPAKLNLFLHITGRRTDGYHELQTVFQFIDYVDELRFTSRSDGIIQLSPDLPNVLPEHNLVVRAACLLQTETNTSLGADIELDKRLPMGGGLGGGSSDAATTLVALNRIWGLNFPLDKLSRLGLRLGADVPVFLRGQAAWAEGIGERLTPIELEEPWYVVVAPPRQVSTQAIFAAPDLTRNTKPITIADFVAGQGGNDCEALVRRLYPEVAHALQWLGKYARARMTGTGACVFGAFEHEDRAQSVAQQFVTEHSAPWQAFAARGMNRSPLYRFTTKT